MEDDLPFGVNAFNLFDMGESSFQKIIHPSKRLNHPYRKVKRVIENSSNTL
jgi:hypothetical protein